MLGMHLTFFVFSAAKAYSPISTYSGRGTLKPGVQPEEHAIAYSYGKEPEILEGEDMLRFEPFCIVGAKGTAPLHKASRIYFGIRK